MYRAHPSAQNRVGRIAGTRQLRFVLQELVYAADVGEEGATLRQRTWGVRKLLRQRREDERGAELIEFAIVVVLLITLLYGIITYGLILAAQATVTQAAADAARSGVVVASANQITSAEAQAGTDVGWMNKGSCAESGTPITCNAVKVSCPSNGAQQCLKVTVSYSYGAYPLFPELPGLGLITPSTITSVNVVQIPAST